MYTHIFPEMNVWNISVPRFNINWLKVIENASISYFSDQDQKRKFTKQEIMDEIVANSKKKKVFIFWLAQILR